jgi:hypothetical protein
VNAYGPTEATVCAALHDCSPDDADPPPIGRPMANVQVHILDEHRQPVPAGVAGELYIGGAGVARGYLNRPELTAERFLPNPFCADASARLYRTGDLGRWLSDGGIEFLGRNDLQVKLRGFRIELGEIEACLNKHSGVREAIVLAREDTAGEKQLVVYYLAEESGADVESLRAHLSAELPEYMVPAAFVELENFPLTPNGKLDRRSLPAPESSAFQTRSYEPPQGETETDLVRIWAELLHVDRIGRRDNFFELGGHSLLAMRVLSRVQSVFEVQISLGDVFALPILTALAERIIELQVGQFSSAQLEQMVRILDRSLVTVDLSAEDRWPIN